MGCKEKIIVFGASGLFDMWYHALKACYTIVGVSDSDPNKKEKIESMSEKFISPSEISKYDFDYIYIASMYFNEIYTSLVYNFKIQRSKILRISRFLDEEIELSLGELNPEKTFYILRHDNKCTIGIFCSILGFMKTLDVIQGLDFNVFIDFQNYRNTYLEDSKLGKVNSWELFFKQPCGEKIENVYNSKRIILGLPLLRKDAPMYCDLSIKPDADTETLFRCWHIQEHKKMYQRFIVLNDDMQMRVETEYNRIFRPIREDGKKICGVLYRGTDYTKLKTYRHEIQPTIEQVIEKTKEMMNEWGFDYIYFDSEDACAFEAFCATFPNKVIYSDRARIREYPDELVNFKFERENDEFMKGMEYIRSVYLMARCNFFISGIFHGAGFSHLISEGFENSFTFKLGYYGLDDDSNWNAPSNQHTNLHKKGCS